MKAKIKITTKQNNEEISTIERVGDVLQNKEGYIISYIESTYDNLITLDCQTNIVVVEKQSTTYSKYYSKLIFEFQKNHKCAIDMDDYTLFVNINTIKVITTLLEGGIQIELQYYIENAFNIVNIEINY